MPEQDPWTALGFVPVGGTVAVKDSKDQWAELGFKPVAPTPPGPTLLESRQRASASEFDANQPQSSPWTRARELLLGGAQGLGVDPARPVVGTASNIAGGLASVVQGAVTHPVDTAVNAFRGIGSALIAGPAEAIEGYKEGDYDKMAHGVGGTITADLPAVYGAAKATTGATNAARTKLAGGPAGFIEQAVLAGKGSREARAVTARIAPELAQDQQLVRAALAGKFDKAALERFTNAERLLNAAEQTVPAGTTVRKAPLLTGIRDQIRALQVDAAPVTTQVPVTTPGKGVTGFQPKTVARTISGHEDALKVLERAYDELDKFPDNIPFADLRKYRQQLDQSIHTHSGWKDTASAADQAAMMAKREVANVIRTELSGISRAMDAANKAYSLASDTVSAAGIDTGLGRRLALVGQNTTAQKVVKGAGKIIGGAAVGHELYRMYRDSR